MKLYYSIPLNSLCNSEGDPLQKTLELIYGDTLTAEITVLGADNTPMDLSAATSWKLSIDVDRNVETAPVCTVQDITYDNVAKTLHYRINTKTAEFFLAVHGKSQLALIAELCGYDATNTRIFRFPWDMVGLMPVDGEEGPDIVPSGSPDYSAFEVYANAEAIAAGTEHEVLGHVTTAIPAQMTEKFTIRSNYQYVDSDVVVDWGDGTTSVVRNGDFESEDLNEWDKEHQFETTTYLSHTYAATGKYTVKIHGRKYFSFSHGRTPANNLMCRCLDKDLPLAGNVNNLAYFAANALRLVNVCIPTAMDFHKIENFSSLFQGCKNLQSAYGLKRKLKIVRSASRIFYSCSALLETDFVLPVCCIETNAEPVECFNGCALLQTPIQNLLPTAGFCNRLMNVLNIFKGCAALTGTVPAALLWEDTSKVWQNTSAAFQGASDTIRAQVPTSWGGTNMEITA